MTAVPAQFADLWGSDRQRQNEAFTALMAQTSDRVAWAGAAWPEVVANLTHRDNHNRAIAGQLLCNLAAHDPTERILADLDALMRVTHDERFVTARHTLLALWRIGLGSERQRRAVVEALRSRYEEAATEKNGRLVRSDIVAGLRHLYDATGDAELPTVAQSLIEAEPNLQYRRKYAGHWTGHLPSDRHPST